jgi:hypothetical protein
MAHNLLIVCTYTPGPPYEDEAKAMVASAARFGYRSQPIAVPDQGDWWRNCSAKPQYFLKAFREHNGPVLWLDADCLVLEPLDDLLEMLNQADLLVKYRPAHAFSALFNTGVMLFRKTPATLSLAEQWAAESLRWGPLHRFPDQATFSQAMLRHQRQIRFQPLPDRFHMMPQTTGDRVPPGCAIFHNKMSRRVRSSALPQQRPHVEVPPAPAAEFMSLGPQPAISAGLPLAGVAGANKEFAEFASRHGISKIWNVSLPLPETDLAGLEQSKLAVMRSLFHRLPAETRVVLCDHDTIWLAPPQPFVDGLSHADLVLAWDRTSPMAIPSTHVIGMKLTSRLAQQILPRAESAYQALRQQWGERASPAMALSQVLRSPDAAGAAHCLPIESVTDLPRAQPQTLAVAVRGEMACIPRRALPAPHVPLYSSVATMARAT